MKRDSFMMYLSFNDAIEELTTEEKGILLEAIFKYQAGAIIPELPKTVKIVFSIMSKQFDRDEIKYQEKVVSRNRINGKEGGRPRKNPDEPKKPSGFINNPNNPDDDDNSVDKDKTVTDAVYADDDVDVTEGAISEILDFYRSSSPNFIKVDLTNSYLLRQLAAMVAKHGPDEIKKAISKAANSFYCNGYNDKGIRATLDWIINPEYFKKLLSGFFDNHSEIPEFDQHGIKITDVKKSNFLVEQRLLQEINNSH